ncbi:MAG: hypothetical protein VX275_13980 [Pseudomonadota bacterium]|nr:hypothetical protein [Pseudomonadota bacterium]
MKYAVMTTWKHKNPIDWDSMKASMVGGPEGTTVQWFQIDEYNHGSLATFASKEVYESIKARQEAYRKEQIGSREIEMTMEAVGPIHVEVGID